MKKIAVFAPHPDDETLGCGGTLLKYKSLGYKIYWIIITSVENNAEFNNSFIKSRQKEIKKVAKKFGFENTFELGFPTKKLDTIPMDHLVNSVSKILSKIKPEEIFLNFGNDIHTDHQVSYKAVTSATKSFRAQYVKKILLYETLSETHYQLPNSDNTFNPNYFVDITKFIKKKCEIMKIYKSEIMEHPKPRSIDSIYNLAKFRGSRCISNFAESFICIFHKS